MSIEKGGHPGHQAINVGSAMLQACQSGRLGWFRGLLRNMKKPKAAFPVPLDVAFVL